MLTGFKVADLPLARFGRKENRPAEYEMPGLMALRRAYAAAQPQAGARVTASLHANEAMDVQPEASKVMAAVWRGLMGRGQFAICIPPPCPADLPRLKAPLVGHPERLVPYALLPPRTSGCGGSSTRRSADPRRGSVADSSMEIRCESRL